MFAILTLSHYFDLELSCLLKSLNCVWCLMFMDRKVGYSCLLTRPNKLPKQHHNQRQLISQSTRAGWLFKPLYLLVAVLVPEFWQYFPPKIGLHCLPDFC